MRATRKHSRVSSKRGLSSRERGSERVKASPNRVVIGYAGDLATTIAIAWLKEHGYGEVIAVAVDVGQGREINQIRDRAVSSGALRCHVLDSREEFAREYILRALQAGVMREPCPPAGALEAPLIAKKLVEIARIENAAAVAHGAAGGAGRLDVALAAIDSAISVVAPARLWNMTVADQIEYARTRNLSASAPIGPSRVHQNLWGRTVRSAVLDDSWKEAPDDLYTLTKSWEQAPTVPAYVELDWDAGVPVSVNGVAMPLIELLDSLETIAGAHGVGRMDCCLAGASRHVYETPAGAVLSAAHAALERLVIPVELQRMKGRLMQEYADVIDSGSWFSASRDAMDAFTLSLQKHVTGAVRIKLYKGDCHAVGVRSASLVPAVE